MPILREGEQVMTDYTPTTEEIRRSLCGTDPVYNELFDRWLAEVKQDAIKKVFSQFSRVTLVDDDRGGIQYERYDIQVEPSIQDNGYTLKLFVKENNNE